MNFKSKSSCIKRNLIISVFLNTFSNILLSIFEGNGEVHFFGSSLASATRWGVAVKAEKAVENGVALSAAVFPTPHISRTCVLQNWPDFADQLDHVCTMIYTPVQWGHPIEWVKDATGQGLAEMKGKCTYYAGFGYPVTKLPPGELRRGMLSAKAGGADGATIFCYPGPSAEQMKEIRESNEEASA